MDRVAGMLGQPPSAVPGVDVLGYTINVGLGVHAAQAATGVRRNVGQECPTHTSMCYAGFPKTVV
jgi:hypothetical protein